MVATLSGWKQAGQKFGQKIRRARREFRRLQHHPIAGGQRRDQRHDREVERIIPWADDADDAHRLIKNAGGGRHQLKPDRNPLRLHPTRQMAQRVADRRLHRNDLAKLGLVTRAIAEIRRDRFGKTADVTSDRFVEPGQIGAPFLQGWRARAQERRPLRIKDVAHRCGGLRPDLVHHVVHNGGLAG